MKKEYKEKRVLRIRDVIEAKIRDDIKVFKKPMSKPISRWIEVINENLKGSQDNISNCGEMASLFKKLRKYFSIEKKTHYIPVGDTFEEETTKVKMYYLIMEK